VRELGVTVVFDQQFDRGNNRAATTAHALHFQVAVRPI
jgi:hypothetical protein